MDPWVSATRTSRGSGGIRSWVASILRRIIPTWGPFPWTRTSPSPEGLTRRRAAARAKARGPWDLGSRGSGRRAFPPKATTETVHPPPDLSPEARNFSTTPRSPGSSISTIS